MLAGPLGVWGSWVGQVLSIGTVRRGFVWRRTLPFLVGGAAGVPLGTWLLPYIDLHVFRAGVGTLLVVYCSIMLCARSLPVLTHGGRWLDGVVGAVGGVMGGLAGQRLSDGPPHLSLARFAVTKGRGEGALAPVDIGYFFP